LWYRRSFTAAPSKGTRLLLHFGAVDWRTEVVVNGKTVGQHEGGYDAFTFDITDALRPGVEQELVVAVWDPTDSALQPRGKQVLNPNGIWYTAVSGIWQTVWLEPVPVAYIREIAMTPDIDAHLLRLTVATAEVVDFTATAKLHGKVVGRVTGKTNAQVKLALSQTELWSPDSPALYDLDIALKSGDSVKSYFGMRSVEAHADAAGVNRIFLNHKPLFQIGRSIRDGGRTDCTRRPRTKPCAPISTRSRNSASTWRENTSRWSPRAGITGAISSASWCGRTCPVR
jgi:beta-galactosidase/beta-glucuronidase